MPTAGVDDAVREALEWLKRHSTKATLDGMARYAIPSDNALGVAMKDIKSLGKQLGRNQELAAALWETGVYEARMLASFVGDPARITAARMDRWCKEFDNWAYCDAMCFNLFDRTPHAWAKVAQWSRSRHEFRETHGVCAPLEPHCPRQASRERAVRARPRLDRKGIGRRPQLRKKGRQHGAASHRQTQPRTERRRPRNGPPPRRVFQRHRPLDRQRRVEGAYRSPRSGSIASHPIG